MQVLQTLYHFPKYPAYFLLRDRLFIFTTILNFVKQTIGIQIVSQNVRPFVWRAKSILLNCQLLPLLDLNEIGMTKRSPLPHHLDKILLLIDPNSDSLIHKFGRLVHHHPATILRQKILLHRIAPGCYLELLGRLRISHNLQVYIFMAICERINILVVSFTIFLATLWFVLIVQLSNPLPNYDKQKGNFEKAGNKGELLTVPLHNTAESYDSLELIQVINNIQPHNSNVKAVLLVTSEWWGKDYENFMQLLSNSRSKGNHFQAPLYLLKQTNNLNYYNHRTLKAHSLSMLHLFQSCIETQSIKRLSILAYEEGALLTLLALSHAKSSLLQSIDKIVLINPFNPDHQLFQNDPKSLVKTIQRNILDDPAMTTSFSKLRIIIINTIRTIYPEQAEVRQYFNFAFQDTTGLFYQLNSTLSLSSKAMWNVHCTLQIHQYFRYEPFTSLLLQLFLVDHKEQLSMKAIEYLFRYRELGQVKTMSYSTRKRYLSNCRVLHLQTLQINSVTIFQDCTFLTIRQRYYYNQAILVLFSDNRFDIYSQLFQKITPYSLKQNKYVYVISNLREISELIIVNPSKKGIGIKITSQYKTLDNYIISFGQGHKTVTIDDENAVIILYSCEGWFPLFGLGSNENYKEIMQWQEGNCFMQLQQRHVYPAWFRYNWNIVRNLIIFTLFCTHVINKLTFNRFYTQLVLNFAILSYTLNHIYMFESMIITSTSTAIELLSKGITKVSGGIALGGNYAWLIVLLPAICEFIAIQYGEPNYMNLQKLLWAQVLWVNSESGFLITIIKCYFMHDIYRTNSASIYSLVLLALWQISNTKGSSLRSKNQLAVTKRRMTDALFLFMLCMSLGQEASVIHQLINFYMITHLLLAAGEMANGLMDQT